MLAVKQLVEELDDTTVLCVQETKKTAQQMKKLKKKFGKTHTIAASSTNGGTWGVATFVPKTMKDYTKTIRPEAEGLQGRVLITCVSLGRGLQYVIVNVYGNVDDDDALYLTLNTYLTQMKAETPGRYLLVGDFNVDLRDCGTRRGAGNKRAALLELLEEQQLEVVENEEQTTRRRPNPTLSRNEESRLDYVAYGPELNGSVHHHDPVAHCDSDHCIVTADFALGSQAPWTVPAVRRHLYINDNGDEAVEAYKEEIRAALNEEHNNWVELRGWEREEGESDVEWLCRGERALVTLTDTITNACAHHFRKVTIGGDHRPKPDLPLKRKLNRRRKLKRLQACVKLKRATNSDMALAECLGLAGFIRAGDWVGLAGALKSALATAHTEIAATTAKRAEQQEQKWAGLPSHKRLAAVKHSLKDDPNKPRRVAGVRLPDGSLSSHPDDVSRGVEAHYTTEPEYGDMSRFLVGENEKFAALHLWTRTPEQHTEPITLAHMPSFQEWTNALHSMKHGTSPGLDNIQTEHLHWLPLVAQEFLWRAACVFYGTKTLPKSLSKGYVKLVHKKGDPTNLNNWRPICLQSVVAKTVTKVLAYRLAAYAEAHGIIGEHQAAFRKKHSTSDKLTLLRSAIEDAQVSNRELAVVYIDLKGAYENVNHDHMIAALQQWNIPTDIITFIHNIHLQATRVFETDRGVTEEVALNRGIVTGDTLAPVTWLLLVETLLRQVEAAGVGYDFGTSYAQLSSAAYADDVALAANDAEGMQTALNVVSDWCKWTTHSVNVNKTVGSVTNRTAQTPLDWKIGEESITVVAENRPVKYLGCQVTLDGSNEAHVNELEKKTDDFLELLRATNIGAKNRVALARECLLPGLLYGAEAFGLNNKDMKRLTKKFDLIIREARGFRNAPCDVVYMHRTEGGIQFPHVANEIRNRMVTARLRNYTTQDSTLYQALTGLDKHIEKVTGHYPWLHTTNRKTPLTNELIGRAAKRLGVRASPDPNRRRLSEATAKPGSIYKHLLDREVVWLDQVVHEDGELYSLEEIQASDYLWNCNGHQFSTYDTFKRDTDTRLSTRPQQLQEHPEEAEPQPQQQENQLPPPTRPPTPPPLPPPPLPPPLPPPRPPLMLRLRTQGTPTPPPEAQPQPQPLPPLRLRIPVPIRQRQPVQQVAHYIPGAWRVDKVHIPILPITSTERVDPVAEIQESEPGAEADGAGAGVGGEEGEGWRDLYVGTAELDREIAIAIAEGGDGSGYEAILTALCPPDLSVRSAELLAIHEAVALVDVDRPLRVWTTDIGAIADVAKAADPHNRVDIDDRQDPHVLRQLLRLLATRVAPTKLLRPLMPPDQVNKQLYWGVDAVAGAALTALTQPHTERLEVARPQADDETDNTAEKQLVMWWVVDDTRAPVNPKHLRRHVNKLPREQTEKKRSKAANTWLADEQYDLPISNKLIGRLSGREFNLAVRARMRKLPVRSHQRRCRMTLTAVCQLCGGGSENLDHFLGSCGNPAMRLTTTARHNDVGDEIEKHLKYRLDQVDNKPSYTEYTREGVGLERMAGTLLDDVPERKVDFALLKVNEDGTRHLNLIEITVTAMGGELAAKTEKEEKYEPLLHAINNNILTGTTASLHVIVLSNIGYARRDTVAEPLKAALDCSRGEERRLTARLVLTVAKGITKLWKTRMKHLPPRTY